MASWLHRFRARLTLNFWRPLWQCWVFIPVVAPILHQVIWIARYVNYTHGPDVITRSDFFSNFSAISPFDILPSSRTVFTKNLAVLLELQPKCMKEYWGLPSRLYKCVSRVECALPLWWLLTKQQLVYKIDVTWCALYYCLADFSKGIAVLQRFVSFILLRLFFTGFGF